MEAYGETTVNYNRDVEIFPVLKAMLESISGESPYQSPTDMGVNMAGNAIVDDEAVREAAKMEIVRRYFQTAVEVKRTGIGHEQAGEARAADEPGGREREPLPRALGRAAEGGDDRRPGRRHGAARRLGGDGQDLRASGRGVVAAHERAQGRGGRRRRQDVLSDEAITPICRLKTEQLHSRNPRLHSDETLIALSISSATDESAAKLIEHVDDLRGCDAFFSVILSATDEKLYRTLGINVCCEPKYEQHRYYHK